MTEAVRTILVVDDEPIILELVDYLLKREGYRVFSASNVCQARACFAHHADSIDLLLSDVSMPDGNGFELAKELLTQQPGLKVLLASGGAGSTSLSYYGLPLSDRHFLAKPFRPAALLARLRELLGTNLSAPLPQPVLGQMLIQEFSPAAPTNTRYSSDRDTSGLPDHPAVS